MNLFKSGQERLRRYRTRLEEQRVFNNVMNGFLATELGDRWAARSSERNKLMRQMYVGAVARRLCDAETRGLYNRADATYTLGFTAVWVPDQRRLTGQDRVEVLSHNSHAIVAFDEFGSHVIYSARIGSFGSKVLIDRRADFVPVPPELADRVN